MSIMVMRNLCVSVLLICSDNVMSRLRILLDVGFMLLFFWWRVI